MIELGEEIFHMPVRLGTQYAGSLADVVQSPRFSPLRPAARSVTQRKRGQKIKEKKGVKDVLEMKSWFAKNFDILFHSLFSEEVSMFEIIDKEETGPSSR